MNDTILAAGLVCQLLYILLTQVALSDRTILFLVNSLQHGPSCARIHALEYFERAFEQALHVTVAHERGCEFKQPGGRCLVL